MRRAQHWWTIWQESVAFGYHWRRFGLGFTLDLDYCFFEICLGPCTIKVNWW